MMMGFEDRRNNSVLKYKILNREGENIYYRDIRLGTSEEAKKISKKTLLDLIQSGEMYPVYD